MGDKCIRCGRPAMTAYCSECSAAFDRAARERFGVICGRFPRMADWSFNTYPDDAASAGPVAAVKTWAGVDDYFEDYCDARDADAWGPQPSLFLWGPVGSGKSGLAWSVLREIVLKDRERGDFVNVRDLFAAARDYYSNGGTDPLKGLDRVEWLVLDDLGAERATEWTRETIATLVERRYVAKLPTIVTSNYSPSGLIRRLDARDPIIGQRIVSRLVENCTVVKVDGPDRRVKRQAA